MSYPLSSGQPFVFKRISIACALIGMMLMLWGGGAPVGADNPPADMKGKAGAPAQTQGQSLGPDAGIKAQVQQTLMRMQQLQQQLSDIQQKVIASNPGLKKAQEAFHALITTTFQEKLDAADVDVERLKALQAQLQQDQEQNTLSAEKKAALQEEFKSQAMKYQNARRQAMTDETVQQEKTVLAADMKAAMIKADPRAEEIISELESLQAGLQQFRR